MLQFVILFLEIYSGKYLKSKTYCLIISLFVTQFDEICVN